jgi:phage baseplate assembly protein gpV
LLNELSLQLGLAPREAIRIYPAAGSLNASVNISGVHLTIPEQDWSATFPLLTVDGDDLWTWKKLSALVREINATGNVFADLVGDDGPALQLNAQNNVKLARGEQVVGSSVTLAHEAFIQGTESFTTDVPSYTVSGQVIRFSGPVPEGAAVNYQYRVSPCTLIASPVGLLSLLDANLASVAVTENNKLVYQMREYLQAIMQQDRSYWGI